MSSGSRDLGFMVMNALAVLLSGTTENTAGILYIICRIDVPVLVCEFLSYLVSSSNA